MSNLARLDFTALDVSRRNYLTRVVDAKLHLASNKLEKIIEENSSASPQDCAKAMILLRRHLHESLQIQYLTVNDPYDLWKSLKDRFGHMKTIILPRARYEWMNLRLQDFKRVSDYNSELFRITSILKLCGESIRDDDLLEKNFSTFHADNYVLQQQYRERGFKTYSDLLSCLILAEENNQLLLNNHQTRPTGSSALPNQTNNLPEANATSSGRGRRKGRGGAQGHGRGRNGQKHNYSGIKPNIQKNVGNNHRRNVQKETTKTHVESPCYKCGDVGHWSRNCHTTPHLRKLYQESLKQKGKGVEANFAEASTSNITHLEADDFLQQVESDKDLPNFGLDFGDLALDEDFY